MNGDATQQPTLIQRTPVWVIWLFIFAVLGVWFWSQNAVGTVAERNQEARHLIRTAQIEACERNNLLRGAHNHQNVIMREILTGSAANVEGAQRQALLEFAARLTDVPLTDCKVAYPVGIETAGVSGD